MTTTITAQSAATRRFTLDPTRSSAGFDVRHFWGLITVHGHFDRFAGSYDGTAIEMTIDADSLDTGNKMRDRHLRSDDFFDVAEHPQVTFRSTTVTHVGDGPLRVEGELRAAGKTVPLAFDATIRREGDELEVEATTTVDHRLLGMTWSPLGMLRTPATLHVKARLI